MLVQCSAACAFVLESENVHEAGSSNEAMCPSVCERSRQRDVLGRTCSFPVSQLPPTTTHARKWQRRVGVLCIEGVAEGTYLTVQEALALIVRGGGGICTVGVGVGVETGILRLSACLCHGRPLIRNRGDGFRQIRQTAAVYCSPGSFQQVSKLQVSVSSRACVYGRAVRDVKTRQDAFLFVCAVTFPTAATLTAALARF